MKVRIHMKTPDSLQDAIEMACEDEVGGAPDDELKDEEFHQLVRKTQKLARKWFQYGELVTLVIDTETETCTVEET